MSVLEHALLPVRAGQEAAFLAALKAARPLISASPGFLGMTVRPPAGEAGGDWLLQVEWGSIADHRDGFRLSDRYQQWRALLHPFYDVVPDVRYFGDAL